MTALTCVLLLSFAQTALVTRSVASSATGAIKPGQVPRTQSTSKDDHDQRTGPGSAFAQVQKILTSVGVRNASSCMMEFNKLFSASARPMEGHPVPVSSLCSSGAIVQKLLLNASRCYQNASLEKGDEGLMKNDSFQITRLVIDQKIAHQNEQLTECCSNLASTSTNERSTAQCMLEKDLRLRDLHKYVALLKSGPDPSKGTAPGIDSEAPGTSTCNELLSTIPDKLTQLELILKKELLANSPLPSMLQTARQLQNLTGLFTKLSPGPATERLAGQCQALLCYSVRHSSLFV